MSAWQGVLVFLCGVGAITNLLTMVVLAIRSKRLDMREAELQLATEYALAVEQRNMDMIADAALMHLRRGQRRGEVRA